MEKFLKSAVSHRLNVVLKYFRTHVVRDYEVRRVGHAYHLRVFSDDLVPEIFITSIIRLGFTFNSVSVSKERFNRLVCLFYIDEKDI